MTLQQSRNPVLCTGGPISQFTTQGSELPYRTVGHLKTQISALGSSEKDTGLQNIGTHAPDSQRVWCQIHPLYTDLYSIDCQLSPCSSTSSSYRGLQDYKNSCHQVAPVRSLMSQPAFPTSPLSAGESLAAFGNFLERWRNSGSLFKKYYSAAAGYSALSCPSVYVYTAEFRSKTFH